MQTHRRNVVIPDCLPKKAKSILIHIISMARIALLYARPCCFKNGSSTIADRLERTEEEIDLLREELRIKDARLSRISPNHRPHYTPIERLAILELKAARGWSDIQTAEVLMVCPDTIAYWSKMLDDVGPKALLQISEPVNKLPDFIKYIVSRLKILCPAMGKVRIAQALTKAGLVLSASTVGRILKNENTPPKEPVSNSMQSSRQTIRARYPNHIWNIDLTIVPTACGFWISWLPNAVPQVWPFCWWLACILDQYSRCVIGFAIFKKQPTAKQLRDFLKRAVHESDCVPKHIVTDKGVQFKSRTFRKWCTRKGITLRYGAVGKSGSIALIERFFKTLKGEWLRKILIPLDINGIRRSLTTYIRWYNFFRPHQGLDGAVPAEIYDSKPSKANIINLQPDDKLELLVTFHDDNRKLPIVQLRKVA